MCRVPREDTFRAHYFGQKLPRVSHKEQMPSKKKQKKKRILLMLANTSANFLPPALQIQTYAILNEGELFLWLWFWLVVGVEVSMVAKRPVLYSRCNRQQLSA